MWGGVKKRGHYGDAFRNWSATRALDDLRIKLWQEPRPWYLAFALHEHAQLLPDAHCARLMSWCTTVVQLRQSAEAKREAFRYAQETFNMLVHSHKAGTETFGEYMRLCAVGKDLSTAFRWHQYWIETDRDGALAAPQLLLQLTWLLRLSLLTPSDESAEDMALAVHQSYTERFCQGTAFSGDSSTPPTPSSLSKPMVPIHYEHYQPIAEDEAVQLRQFFAAFKQLRPRIQAERLGHFIDCLPISDVEAKRIVCTGWPSAAKSRGHSHHTFAELEHGVSWHPPTLLQPRLRDSLLHSDFVAALEQAAFDHRVGDVISLLREYEERVRLEADKRRGEGGGEAAHARRIDRWNGNDAGSASWHGNELWRQRGDTTAIHFRRCLVFGVSSKRRNRAETGAPESNREQANRNSLDNSGLSSHGVNSDTSSSSSDCSTHANDSDTSNNYNNSSVSGGGELTSELYHYLIVALSVHHPTAALRTLQRMRKANLRILDLTRTIALVAASGSWTDQVALFTEQLQEMKQREQLDRDFELDKVIEAYWKYQHPLFLHYRNALDKTTFYRLLMDGLGVAVVQQLLTAAHVYDGRVTGEENYVALDDALRRAAVTHLRARSGAVAVQQAMDVITRDVPRLDVSVIGSVPHFDHYALPAHDSIATDAAMLQTMLSGYEAIFVLDTSFVETSEYFVHIGSENARRHLPLEASPPCRCLVLVPYLVLTQLAQSMALRHEFYTADPALQESVQAEPFLASQRLRALCHIITRSAEVQSQKAKQEEGLLKQPREQREQRQKERDLLQQEDSSSPANAACTTTVQKPVRPERHVRLLHFSECLLAHALSPDILSALALAPDRNDDDQLILVLAMLRALAPHAAAVTLCSDDAVLQSRVRQLQQQQQPKQEQCRLFAAPVALLCTEPPAHVDTRTNLINDNPSLPVSLDFEPKLDFGAAFAAPEAKSARRSSRIDMAGGLAQGTRGCGARTTDDGAAADARSEAVTASWLDMLDESSEEEVHNSGLQSNRSSHDHGAHAEDEKVGVTDMPGKDVRTGGLCGTSMDGPHERRNSTTADAASAQAKRSLGMQLYENEHDVIPIGVKMEQASHMGSIFEQFHVCNPEEAELQRINQAAVQSRLRESGKSDRSSNNDDAMPRSGARSSTGLGAASTQSHGRSTRSRRLPPRSSVLSREARANRGLSVKERMRLARSLSNHVGKRVPFNLRYRAVYANVNDPRYAHLRTVYKEQLDMKRRAFRRSMGQA